MTHLPAALLMLLMATLPVFAQSDSAPNPLPEKYCEISRDPAAYNHRLVRLTGFVTHGFEDFQMVEPTCPTQDFHIWLMYGGKAESNTPYCCPGESSRDTRSNVLTVEGIQVPLVNDHEFQQFTELLRKESDTTVRATVVGRFFSGEKVSDNTSTHWRGFGHMGCCSLLVLEQVESFEPHTRGDVDYTAEAGWYEDEGCKWGGERDRRHVSVSNWNGAAQQAIAEQESADAGRTWVFSDPKRVALESLELFYPGQTPALRTVKSSPSRYVFQWRNNKKSVVLVVTRPYWLSFFAASDSVAWVNTMTKEAECN